MRFKKHDLIMKIFSFNTNFYNYRYTGINLHMYLAILQKKNTKKQLIVQLLNAQIRKTNTGVDQRNNFRYQGGREIRGLFCQ